MEWLTPPVSLLEKQGILFCQIYWTPGNLEQLLMIESGWIYYSIEKKRSLGLPLQQMWERSSWLGRIRLLISISK
jgi:hypothetical protein